MRFSVILIRDALLLSPAREGEAGCGGMCRSATCATDCASQVRWSWSWGNCQVGYAGGLSSGPEGSLICLDVVSPLVPTGLLRPTPIPDLNTQGRGETWALASWLLLQDPRVSLQRFPGAPLLLWYPLPSCPSSLRSHFRQGFPSSILSYQSF